MLFYLILAGLVGLVARLFRNSHFRHTEFYRFFWLIVICIFVRFQFFLWYLQFSFHAISGPDGGFAGMALGLVTLAFLPFTAVGFFLCFLWPKNKRLISWQSILVVFLALGVWATGSWIWHLNNGVNREYMPPFKVVDQLGKPVVGAQFSLDVSARREYWLEMNETFRHLGNQKNKNKRLMLMSDTGGIFNTKGLRAESVNFCGLVHSNYLCEPMSSSVQLEPGRLFRMWKRLGAAQLVGSSLKSMIPSDGQSIWIAENSDKCSRTELPDAIFKLKVNRERRIVTFDDKSSYKWGFEINMLGGGIQKTDDLFLYQAPESGYNSLLSVSHEAGAADWIREQKVVFYFKTNKGKYGRGEVFVSNWENESEVYFRMSFVLNPDGSRNLEPKPDF